MSQWMEGVQLGLLFGVGGAQLVMVLWLRKQLAELEAAVLVQANAVQKQAEAVQAYATHIKSLRDVVVSTGDIVLEMATKQEKHGEAIMAIGQILTEEDELIFEAELEDPSRGTGGWS